MKPRLAAPCGLDVSEITQRLRKFTPRASLRKAYAARLNESLAGYGSSGFSQYHLHIVPAFPLGTRFGLAG